MDESDVDKERRNKSEALRKQRVNEAKSLVAQRGNVRALWENTGGGGSSGLVGRNGKDSSLSPPPTPPQANPIGGMGRPAKRWPPVEGTASPPEDPSPEPYRQAAVSNNQLPDLARSSGAGLRGPHEDVPPPVPHDSGNRNPVLPSSPHVSSAIQPPRPDVIPPDSAFPHTAPSEPVPSAHQALLKNSIRSVAPPRPPDSDEEEDNDADWDDPPLEDGPRLGMGGLNLNGGTNDVVRATETYDHTPQSQMQPSPHQEQEDISAKDPNLGVQAQALWDYQAADDTEISFDPGDILNRIDMIDEGWWQGAAPDGSYGLFPANYVQLLQ